MTDTTLAPTDAALWDAWRTAVDTTDPTQGNAALKFARAVLAKWGAPAPASGEPVALRYRMRGDLQWQYTENPDQASHADVIQRIATTAQEARVPLSDGQIEQGHDAADIAPTDATIGTFTDGVRFAEKHHGITAAHKEASNAG